MSRKKLSKESNNPDQLELFDLSKFDVKNNSTSVEVVQSTPQTDTESYMKAVDESINDTNTSVSSNEIDKNKISESGNTTEAAFNRLPDEILELIIPETYEETLQQEVNQQKISQNLALMAQFITPVIEFEEKIIQVVSQIKLSGYLLFLYGISGVGKSTFISSLEWRSHIPIKKIHSINARKLPSDNSDVKLKELLKRINEVTETFFQETNNRPEQEKFCIVIDYLENLQDEDEKNVRAFFRDLNGLFREYPILIIWPVTDKQDLETMQDFAKSFSSTMFHQKIPTLEFTGPPIEEYPTIAKNTIAFFNQGRTCYDFQLNDEDFNNIIKNKYEEKPKDRLIIREYLREIRDLSRDRTQYTQQLMQTVPKPTEVWFIFSYPEAESVVAQFAKQSDNINEMWNANYNALFTYIKENNQRKADWKPGRLTLALNGILTTKIMYLPTNALVSCIAAYSKEAKIPISKEDFLQEYGVLNHWFAKRNAKNTLSTTPLYLQLLSRPITAGKRKSGTVEKGLTNATIPFQKINKDIVNNKISDSLLNKSLYLALQDLYQESNLSFSCEKPHPNLPNIRPDILVNAKNEKYIALEFCYTVNDTPGHLAGYVLSKLNTYMKQLEQSFGFESNFR
ncbi:ATP-binding protein [Microcoleus sp. Pol14C6]|uniref:ATP-binding protein n=1 Tax=unclassified Microcoleus TaxID=2642155 RepID=UPI002FD72EF3